MKKVLKTFIELLGSKWSIFIFLFFYLLSIWLIEVLFNLSGMDARAIWVIIAFVFWTFLYLLVKVRQHVKK